MVLVENCTGICSPQGPSQCNVDCQSHIICREGYEETDTASLKYNTCTCSGLQVKMTVSILSCGQPILATACGYDYSFHRLTDDDYHA